MAWPCSGLCSQGASPLQTRSSPQITMTAHQHALTCRASYTMPPLCSRPNSKICHVCSGLQEISVLSHQLKDGCFGAAESIWFKKVIAEARRHFVAVHVIMTQEALWDTGTSNENRASFVEAGFPTCMVPLVAPSPLRTLEAFSYEELLGQLELLTNCGDQHGILYHLVRRCASERDLTRGREVHNHVKKYGFASDVLLGSQLIQMYASLDHLVEARGVFDGLPDPDLFSWTAIISAHATLGENHTALRLYFQLQSSNAKLDGPVFMAALKACAAAAALEEGKLIHADIIGSGCETHNFVGNTVVDMYAKCGNLQEASLVFNRLPQHDIVAWNALLAGYSNLGYSQEMLEVFDQMQGLNVVLSHVSFVFILKACATLGALELGKYVHTLIIENGLDSDLSVSSALLDMYAKSGSLHDASIAFERILTPDIVLWSNLIAAYVNDSHGHFALEIFYKMQRDSVMPNEITYNSVLKACTSIGAFEEGKRIHSLVIASGFESNAFLGSTLIDMYCKSGELEDAYSVFDASLKRDVSSWNAMIGGYAQHGFGQEALQLFYRMQQKGFELDKITMIFILKACSCVSALEQGRWVHAHIISRGFMSDIQVGSTLIDMYGKCGSLEDASVVFESLHKRDVAVWNIVMASCSQHNNYSKAYGYFKAMQNTGFMPDEVTYLCLLAACSRAGLANEGRSHFKSLVLDYCIAPTLELFVSFLSCVGRAGLLKEAEDLIESLPILPLDVGWMSLLGSCRVHADVDLGRRCFDRIVQLNPGNATAYVFMSDIYYQVGMREEAERIERWRNSACAWKKPAKAFIEVNNQVHDFIVGDKTHSCSSKLYAKIKDVTLQMNEQGFMPLPRFTTTGSFSEKDEKDALSGHCEKLAIAFGLISTPAGSTIRVSKNLRMCDDCHHITKFMSRLELREIVVNDAFCVHHFKDGVCSCKDLF